MRGWQWCAGAALAGAAIPPAALAAPPVANVEQHRGRVPVEKDLARHQALLASRDRLVATGGTQLVLIGDSIIDFWRADPQREILENAFGRYRPLNLGVSADETQHVLWRIAHGELDRVSPALVMVLIGTNNLANANHMGSAETADGVAAVVAAIRAKLPASRILLLGIFPRANRADDPMRLAVAATNRLIAGLADDRVVFYRDIGPSFLGANGSLSGEIMPDYLHHNAAGYQLWADAIRPEVEALIAPTTAPVGGARR